MYRVMKFMQFLALLVLGLVLIQVEASSTASTLSASTTTSTTTTSSTTTVLITTKSMPSTGVNQQTNSTTTSGKASESVVTTPGNTNETQSTTVSATTPQTSLTPSSTSITTSSLIQTTVTPINSSIPVTSSTSMPETTSTSNTTNFTSPATTPSSSTVNVTSALESTSQPPTSENSSTVQTSTAAPSSPTSPLKIQTTSSTAPSTNSPSLAKVLINEFTFSGLFASGRLFFVELKHSGSQTDENMTLVVLTMDGTDFKCLELQNITLNGTLTLSVYNFTLKSHPKKTVVVSLYASETWTSCDDFKNSSMTENIQDMMIVSKEEDAEEVNKLTAMFKIRQPNSVLIADESKLKAFKEKYSISRCGGSAMDFRSFIVAKETKNAENNCTNDGPLKVKMTFDSNSGVDCTDLNNETTLSFVKTFITQTVGGKCACGLSPYLIGNNTFACSSMTITWFITYANEDQMHLINSTFYSTLKEGTCLKNNSLCLKTPHMPNGHHPLTKKTSNISVTVGVVITCVIVFLIIVGVVIIYIRKRRRGILQFRMTRLNDDDDDLIGQDTDDFVGSQDASFSNSSYTRFK